MELDHVIVCVAGPDAVAPLFPGFVLDAGTRHIGQGTRNRRVVFARNYVEVLWVDDPEAERTGGLGFAARGAGPGPRARSASCSGGRSASRTEHGMRLIGFPAEARRCCCSTPRRATE